MNAVYHTFNRYLPAIGRVLQVLQSYGPIGTTLQICNRDLARAADCSAGRIPALLRTLEADHEIERVTSPQGSLIVVLGDASAIDRSDVSDQHMADRLGVDSAQDRSTMVDPPTPPNRYKQHDQQQALAALDTNPLYQRLMRNPDMNESLAMRVVEHAPGTLADFLADLAAVPHYIREPLFWLSKIWASGKRPKPRTKVPRHAAGSAAATPADNRPVPTYFERLARPNALPPEQIRAKLAAMPRPDWTVKAVRS